MFAFDDNLENVTNYCIVNKEDMFISFQTQKNQPIRKD